MSPHSEFGPRFDLAVVARIRMLLAGKRLARKRIGVQKATATDCRGLYSRRPTKSVAVLLRGTSLAREALHELDQAAQRDSRGTFRDPGLLIFHPCRAGDIVVNPWRVLGELFEEHRGIDGPAPAPAGVDDVGDGGLDVVFVFVVECQPPPFFPGLMIRFVEAPVNPFIV